MNGWNGYCGRDKSDWTHTHTHTQMVARGKKEKKGSNTIEVEETFQVYVNTIMEVP